MDQSLEAGLEVNDEVHVGLCETHKPLSGTSFLAVSEAEEIGFLGKVVLRIFPMSFDTSVGFGRRLKLIMLSPHD